MSRLTEASPRVSAALETRFSCRAFLDSPIPQDILQAVLTTALRAPSGGNLQPWHVWCAGGDKLQELVGKVREKAAAQPMGEGAEYHIYPPELAEPYRTRRSDIGARLYEVLGIARDDKAGRAQQMARNFDFFGAPCAMFFAIDKSMQQGQWSDLGMLLQSICLLLREYGLHSCPQEAWAVWAPTVKKFFSIPDEMIFFCALAIGHADPDAVVNRLESPRAPLDEVAHFVGF